MVIDTGDLARDNRTTAWRTQLPYREEATGTCAAIHATKHPSVIVIKTASIIVIALRLCCGASSHAI